MFPTLPGEVIERVASFIEDSVDIFAFRLVCRRSHAYSKTAFGRLCFSTLSSDLSKDSINRLREVAKIDGVASQVRCLRLVLEERHRQDTFGSGFSWPRGASGCITEVPQEVSSLREILSQQWVNCTSFEILEGQFQFHTHSRNPEAGLRPIDVLAILLDDFDKANLRVTSLSLQLPTQTRVVVYNELRPSRFEHDPFQGLWGSSLRHLDLALELEMNDFTDAVIRMITKTTNLQHLALNLAHSQVSNDFIDRLTTQLTGSAPALTAFRLAYTGFIKTNTIQQFLLLFAETLSSVAFKYANLEGWDSILRSLQSYSKLRCLTVFNCFDGDYPDKGRTFFCGLRDPTTTSDLRGKLEITDLSHRKKVNRAGGFRYQGSDMQEALAVIANTNYTLYREGPASPGLPGKPMSGDLNTDKIVQLPPTPLDPFGW